VDRNPGVCVTFFRPVTYGLGELGLEWRPLFSSCGIDPDLLDDSDARIPTEMFEAFWPRAAELTGDPCLGLHIGEQVRPLAVNIVGYLMMSSPTVREGLERVVRYQRLVLGRDEMTLVDRAYSPAVRFVDATWASVNVVQVEYLASLVLKFLDWITAIHFHASEVHFRHSPRGERSEYERILGCPVKFQCEYAELLLPRTGLNQPSLYASPEIAQLHQEHAERHLAELEDESIARKVKTLLMSHLDGGSCKLDETARTLQMSTRTLQRRLAEEGLSFSDLVDSLRRNLSLHHLENPNVGLAEIAYVAGFSDASAFNRAVRRWTGQTPLDFRRSRRQG